MSLSEKVARRDITLERLMFVAQQKLPRAILQNLRVENVPDFIGDGLVYQLRAAIYAQRLDEQRVEYPADWWEAFKGRFFPRWALARWPIRHTVKTMRLYAWYPDKLLPGDRSQFLIQTLDGESATYDPESR